MNKRICSLSVWAIVFLFTLCTSANSADEMRPPPKNLDFGDANVIFSSSVSQSRIKSDKALGTLAKENPAVGEEAISFGFAAKSKEAKFFIIGSLYSEALAFLRSGDHEQAAKRLEAIEKEFIRLSVPSSLYNYVSKTRHLVSRQKYAADVLVEYLCLFQPFFEDYAKGISADMLTLFRAGTWLVDTSLAAAAGDKSVLRQHAQLNHIIKEMKRMDAPKGVLKALDNIAEITKKKEISDRDTKKVLKLVKKIQTILG